MNELDNRIEKGAERQIDDLVGALTDPIIVWPGGWGDSVPQQLKNDIQLQRLAQLIKGEEGLATDAEAAVYLMTASLDFPLNGDWVEIYQYVFTRTMGDKTPDDLRVDRLDSYRMTELLRLKRWLWNRRIRERQDRRKAEKRAARAEAAARAPVQLGLFNK